MLSVTNVGNGTESWSLYMMDLTYFKLCIEIDC